MALRRRVRRLGRHHGTPHLAASVLVASACLSIGLLGRRALVVPRISWSASTDLRSLAPWIAVFVLFCLWELAAFLLGNDDAHPTFSILTEGILEWFPLRALAIELVAGSGRASWPPLRAVFTFLASRTGRKLVLFVVWCWFGWHFLAR
ncbi:MAG TPA: DUF6186 family protein [Acidimicrobiales bacterium]